MDLAHINELIRTHTLRLQQLELHQARKGIDTEAHVQVEIETLRQALAELEAQRKAGKAQDLEPQRLASSLADRTSSDSRFYLAAHPRLGGVAEGQQPGETLIDWTRDFLDGDPASDDWDRPLMRDLLRHQQMCRREGKTMIWLRAFARNSAGLAFGFIFCQRAGFHICYSDNRSKLWRTDEPTNAVSPLTRSDTVVSETGSDLVLELAVTASARDVSGPVDTWLQSHSVAMATAGPQTQSQLDAAGLRRLLVDSFNDGELRDLCFDLGIDYDDLPGQAKSDKARELVAYANRRARSADLLAACRHERPHAEWDSLMRPGTPGQAQDRGVRKRILLALERARLEITPHEGAAIAWQICDLVSREGRLGGTVHLFGALPLGVLVLTGWGLKAERTIQFYDLDARQQYQPTCLLKS